MTPYGDEAVTLKGAIKVKPAGHHSTIEGMKLHGAGDIGPKIYADGTVLRDNEITNEHTSTCVHVASWYDGPAPEGVVIERNRIHDCGELPSTNKEHGIYLSEARDAIVRDNWIYDNVDRGVQQYFEVHGARITGNVIVGNGQGLNFSGGSDQIVEGNIIASANRRWNVYAGSTGSPGEGVLRDNCVFADEPDFTANGGIESSNVFAEADNLIAKPRFADPDAGDFHLEPGDPCLAKYTGTMSLSDGAPAPPLPPPPPSPPAGGSPTVTLRASTPAVRPGARLEAEGQRTRRSIGGAGCDPQAPAPPLGACQGTQDPRWTLLASPASSNAAARAQVPGHRRPPRTLPHRARQSRALETLDHSSRNRFRG